MDGFGFYAAGIEALRGATTGNAGWAAWLCRALGKRYTKSGPKSTPPP